MAREQQLLPVIETFVFILYPIMTAVLYITLQCSAISQSSSAISRKGTNVSGVLLCFSWRRHHGYSYSWVWNGYNPEDQLYSKVPWCVFSGLDTVQHTLLSTLIMPCNMETASEWTLKYLISLKKKKDGFWSVGEVQYKSMQSSCQ